MIKATGEVSGTARFGLRRETKLGQDMIGCWFGIYWQWKEGSNTRKKEFNEAHANSLSGGNYI